MKYRKPKINPKRVKIEIELMREYMKPTQEIYHAVNTVDRIRDVPYVASKRGATPER